MSILNLAKVIQWGGVNANSDVFQFYLSDCRVNDRRVDSQIDMMDCRTGLLLLTVCWAGEDFC